MQALGCGIDKTPVDLVPFMQAGVIHACDLESEREMELLVQLATRLDDGEAACFAIAQSRGWLLATDDRPATKLAAQAGLTVITTPEMVQRWANHDQVAAADVASAIHNIQSRARFVPRADSPEAAWWFKMQKQRLE